MTTPLPRDLPTGSVVLTATAPDAGATADTGLLNRLRLQNLRCRAAARTDLHGLYAHLASSGDAEPSAYVEALLLTLGQSPGGHGLQLFRPGAVEISLDERWLLSLIAALRRGDEASASFLLQSRIGRQDRRPVAFLAGGVARHLDMT
jgi:hypothetical protein